MRDYPPGVLAQRAAGVVLFYGLRHRRGIERETGGGQRRQLGREGGAAFAEVIELRPVPALLGEQCPPARQLLLPLPVVRMRRQPAVNLLLSGGEPPMLRQGAEAHPVAQGQLLA